MPPMSIKDSFRTTNEFRVRIDGKFCVYCGELAGALEHFPPASYSLHGYLLPACHECNCMAGTSYPLDFQKRAELVNSKIRFKYRKELRVPEWSNSEMRPLRYNLKKGIEQWQKMQRIARERVAWSALAYLSNIDMNTDFAALDALKGITLESEESCLNERER